MNENFIDQLLSLVGNNPLIAFGVGVGVALFIVGDDEKKGVTSATEPTTDTGTDRGQIDLLRAIIEEFVRDTEKRALERLELEKQRQQNATLSEMIEELDAQLYEMRGILAKHGLITEENTK